MEREIELILDSTHDAMIAVDRDGLITLFNKAAATLTNKLPSDALGHPVEEVIENTRLPFILKTGKSELNRKQPLGNITIVTNRMPVLNEHGEIVGAIAVFRDITEVQELAEEITNLKEIQGMLEAIFNSTQDAISVVDQNGIGVLINPAYTRITGYTKKDVVGKMCTVDFSEGESVHLKVLETSLPVKGARMKVGINRKEVLVEAAPIMVGDMLRGSVAVIHDLSEINRLITELDQAKQLIRNLEAKYTFADIRGRHSALQNAIEKARLAAATPATVVLRGESGTGKELFAHAIHNASDRKYAQFVRVNCAAINENILESELFGYDEGAFTGASKGGKKGLFERAHGGTLFLDEIGEISINMQTKLLRVLQEKEIVRVGGTKAIPVDVRVISATNLDLEKAVSDGRFRKDLYYRIHVFPISIPPLREHIDDIKELAEYFIIKYNQEFGRNVNDLSEEALDWMMAYDWPGNVRELENFIGRALINMKITETSILRRHLPNLGVLEHERAPEKRVIEKTPSEQEVVMLSLNHQIEQAENHAIQAALDMSGGNREVAAKMLKISLRSLYYKIHKYEIHHVRMQ
jgi:PAS domain S-box-containing protein